MESAKLQFFQILLPCCVRFGIGISCVPCRIPHYLAGMKGGGRHFVVTQLKMKLLISASGKNDISWVFCKYVLSVNVVYRVC